LSHESREIHQLLRAWKRANALLEEPKNEKDESKDQGHARADPSTIHLPATIVLLLAPFHAALTIEIGPKQTEGATTSAIDLKKVTRVDYNTIANDFCKDRMCEFANT
jgi:hypothetical protein